MTNLSDFMANPPPPEKEPNPLATTSDEEEWLEELASALTRYCENYPCGERCACDIAAQVRNQEPN